MNAIFLREHRAKEREQLLHGAFVWLFALTIVTASHYAAFWIGGELKAREIEIRDRQRIEAPKEAYSCRDALQQCLNQMNAARKRKG